MHKLFNEILNYLFMFIMFNLTVKGFLYVMEHAFPEEIILMNPIPIPAIVPLELQSIQELRTTLRTLLEFSITNLGESLPAYRSWEDLALALHQNSEDREFLIFLINSLSTLDLENLVVRYSILIVLKWRLPFRRARMLTESTSHKGIF